MPIAPAMADIAAGLPKRKVLAPRLRSFGDDRLGRLAAAGDKRAFAVVYERHQQAIYRYCRSLLGNPDDAADALQNTMAAALRGLKGETREIRLKPWLFRIAHNECVAILRTRGPEVAIDDSLEAAAEDEPLVRERLRQLMSDLQELTPHQRGALVMRELSALSYDDVAVVLGGSPAAARQTVYEARTALHELAEGRAMECETVRRALSDNDGRVLRGRKLRSHLRACGSCRDFRALIGSRKRDLAMLAPPLPIALAGGAAAGKAFLASGLVKSCAAVAATAAVAGGTVEAVHVVEQSKPTPVHHVKKHHAAVRVAKRTKVAPPVVVKAAAPVAAAAPLRSSARPVHVPAARKHRSRRHWGQRRAALREDVQSVPLSVGHRHHANHSAPADHRQHDRHHSGSAGDVGFRGDASPRDHETRPARGDAGTGAPGPGAGPGRDSHRGQGRGHQLR